MTYAIGTEFMTLGKHPRVCTIRDVWTTYNTAGEVVRIEYVSDSDYIGGKLEQTDSAVSIARGIARLNGLPY